MRNVIQRFAKVSGAGWVWLLLILPAQAQDKIRFELLVDSGEVPAGDVFDATLRASWCRVGTSTRSTSRLRPSRPR